MVNRNNTDQIMRDVASNFVKIGRKSTLSGDSVNISWYALIRTLSYRAPNQFWSCSKSVLVNVNVNSSLRTIRCASGLPSGSLASMHTY